MYKQATSKDELRNIPNDEKVNTNSFKMATSTWIPPLPAGYEARWDPNQRAYFFINHSTKTTTWQDPRWPAGSQAQGPAQTQHHAQAQSHHGHAQAQSHHSAAAHSLNKGFTSSGEGQNVPMSTMYKQFGGTTTRADNSEDEDWEGDWDSDMETELPFSVSTGDHGKVDIAKLHQLKQLFPSASEDSIKQALRTNNNVLGMAKMQLTAAGYQKEEPSSHPPPRQVDMLERLHAMFPTANKELVSDILYQANYDEKAARNQLEAIGYKAQYTPTHKSSSAHKSSLEASPAKKSVSPARSPVRQASPTRPTVSEADKSKLMSKLKREYRDTEESVIKMAVEVCDYDETRVKNLLDRMTAEESAPRPSSSKTSSSSRHRSPSPTPVFSATSLEPVAFDVDFSTSDQRTKKSTTSTISSRTTPTKTSRTPTPKSSATPTPRSSSSSARQQTRTKNVTEHRRPQTVVSRQPQGSSYMSENRTVAKGPDHTLRVGPNRDLLIQEYVLAKGPNPELRQGPDRSRVLGPQGAVGPDPSLRCGPQAGLSKGTSSENLLVSAI